MKLRPLVLNEASRADIQRVKRFADLHRVPLGQVLDTVAGKAGPVGNNPAYTCVVPFGYRCCFSIEDQPKGTFRHLSISVSGDGYAPSTEAAEALALEFGFTGSLKDWAIYEEKYSGVNKAAINFLQRL